MRPSSRGAVPYNSSGTRTHGTVVTKVPTDIKSTESIYLSAVVNYSMLSYLHLNKEPTDHGQQNDVHRPL